VIGSFAIRRAGPDLEMVPALASLLVDCVEAGASVGFLLPLDRTRAEAFWTRVLESMSRGERIVLAAEEAGSGAVLGTVQVVLAMAENQPHRCDVAKLLVSPRARRRGLGEALMLAAEAAALEAGRTLLVLDTAGDEAERLYRRLGWREAGRVPRFALWPSGEPCATTFFYKDLAG